MPPKFGTSGLRGLVSELTTDLITAYTHAFLQTCPLGGGVHVGWDLRPSSPEIAATVIAAIRAAGIDAYESGAVPTPALALSAMTQGHAAIMVTGSHIPADRNGLKFYVPQGEISKADEERILAAFEARSAPQTTNPGRLISDSNCISNYVSRYREAFGSDALQGLRIGVYQHSSVARDIMVDVVAALGATPVPLARSDVFIPVDTEAVDPETRSQLQAWVKEHALDAVISTDGDADRPMLANATGDIVAGDVLGPLTARFLGATNVCTPVSSNSIVEMMGHFANVDYTKIGSPFVIAAMEQALAQNSATKVIGYEANGGVLLGFSAQDPCGALPPLMTRDCLLPILAPLAAANASKQSIAALVASLPSRFTAADRLQGIEPQDSAQFLAEMTDSPEIRATFFSEMPAELSCDTTDGLRVTFEGGDIVHLRPSGNAPEFRCYAESASAEAAAALVAKHLALLQDRLG
ncbi:phosphomannomutase [Shimia sediminis]|uniref:phosphomannomutase n=1 Tax=Shimia sediminis TaxID=2497945 RepID=UPI000F8EB3CC|nr:phosphomannomutase [Shimia sediminis]